MPTYVYKFVDTGETIEVQQSFTDDTLTEIAHPDSGEVMAVKKVFTPVGVTFRGSGFFKTDSRGAAASSSTSDGAGSASSSDGSSGSDAKRSTSDAKGSAGDSKSSAASSSTGAD